jgi:hypothetical protein
MTRERILSSSNGMSASELAARYEALRAHAVQSHVPGSREGLVVLLRHGLAAWMEVWSTLPAPPALPKDERRRPPALPAGAGAEVVHILAAMTLGQIQEVHA